MSLFNFVDKVGPVVPANYLNALDLVRNAMASVAGGATTIGSVTAGGNPGTTGISISQTGVVTLPVSGFNTKGILDNATATALTLLAQGNVVLVGTPTNDNAAVGQVGEYQTNTTTGITLATGTNVNGTSVSLTAGDWDVQALANIPIPTTLSAWSVGVSTVSLTLGATGTYQQMSFSSQLPVQQEYLASPVVRVSIAGTTTVFCVFQATFTGTITTAQAFIRARRVR